MTSASRILFAILGMSTLVLLGQQQAPPKPAPEMQKLLDTLAGSWVIAESYEPSEWAPKGGTGRGHEAISPGQPRAGIDIAGHHRIQRHAPGGGIDETDAKDAPRPQWLQQRPDPAAVAGEQVFDGVQVRNCKAARSVIRACASI